MECLQHAFPRPVGGVPSHGFPLAARETYKGRPSQEAKAVSERDRRSLPLRGDRLHQPGDVVEFRGHTRWFCPTKPRPCDHPTRDEMCWQGLDNVGRLEWVSVLPHSSCIGN